MFGENHTVEKVGGTSMSDFRATEANVFVGSRTGERLYNRIFVVSAYGGITDKLLEDKRGGDPGVFEVFRTSDKADDWENEMSEVQTAMLAINDEMFSETPKLREKADSFIIERLEGARNALNDLNSLCSFGQFHLGELLNNVREMLAGLGEAHSAFNTTLMLQDLGVNARFADLTGWKEDDQPTLDERITNTFKDMDLTRELPVATGYAHCAEGLMRTYDRGYSEVTFSKIACITHAREAIIHKEYHLSSADPRVVGADNAIPMGRTNYDVADQLSNMGMEAIHPRAARGLRQLDIPLRIKNTFEPEHEGTVISNDWERDDPRAEIITGRDDIYAIEVFEQDMAGFPGYDSMIMKELDKYKVRAISKDMNANSITHYLARPLKTVKRIVSSLEEALPGAEVSVRKVAIVSVIASDLADSALLSLATKALCDEGLPILAMQHSSRRKDVRFVVKVEDEHKAIRALHRELVEKKTEKDAVSLAAV
ncbi:aspartate kinase [Yunchengibacter salinarum]|uniref:aspartate kinase n=1 Tax=Yunchengibacter salinarum TaxID=3133399 RepID=UPI0035B60E3C